MSDTKSIVLPMFDGKEEHFQVWWTKFRAFGTAKGFVAALLGEETELPTTEDQVLDETVPDQLKKIKARARNALAMAYMLSALKSEADVSMAYETMTDEWPGGKAHVLVTKLMEVHQPKDSVTEIELYK